MRRHLPSIQREVVRRRGLTRAFLEKGKTVGEMKPSVGRIVHYQAYGTPGGEFPSVPRAAIIAEVHSDEDVSLVVLNPQGLFFNRVKFSEIPTPGRWNWPPRV